MPKNIISYLKIAGALFLIFPLIHCFWLLEFGDNVKAYKYSITMYVSALTLGIIMFNYLEGYTNTKK